MIVRGFGAGRVLSSRTMNQTLDEGDVYENQDTGNHVRHGKFIDDDVLEIIGVVNFSIVCQIIDILGIISNAISIYVFIKQGFSDTVNISLFGLSISDLGCLITLLWHNLCFNPLFRYADLPFDPIGQRLQYLSGGWPHVIFTRITACITAFIALERCLCIAMPLRVKAILTHKLVTAIVVGIFFVLLASASPIYYANRYEWLHNSNSNKTILTLTFTPDREHVESISFAINNIFVNFFSFFVVLTCSGTLVVKLFSKARWRQSSTSTAMTETSSKFSTISTKDRKVSKMVVTISAMFIFCFTPASIILIVAAIEPEFSIAGEYQNMYITTFSVAFILESVNSSANLFIYYEMSSKFRAVVDQCFCCKRKIERTNRPV